MLISELKKINKTRLGEWGTILNENQSTPLVLIGVGHNSNRGELYLCICEGVSEDGAAGFLRAAAEIIDPEKKGGN